MFGQRKMNLYPFPSAIGSSDKDEFKSLPKSVGERLIRYAEKGLRKLEEPGNM